VLTQLAGEVGLDEQEFKEALESRKYKEEHQKALYHAYQEAGITAVPTFIIGDRVLQGMYGKETLESVIEEEAGKQKLDITAEGASCGIDGC
jgi:predicted DsbA family dithiol-disulfide isomerase